MSATTALRCSRLSARPSVARGSRTVCNAAGPSAIQRVQLAAATIALSAGVAVVPAFADGVQFANIQDGSKVQSPVHVEFKVDGMTVKPAAEGLIEGTGHFHVLIDEKAPAEGEAIPFDDSHKHYGKGQLADDVALAPGKHSLTLQFANAAHLSYGPKFAKTVTVTVQ